MNHTFLPRAAVQARPCCHAVSLCLPGQSRSWTLSKRINLFHHRV